MLTCVFMQCFQCHAENRKERRFCAECGASLNLACPSCGFSNQPGERFCGGCGSQIAEAASAPESKFSSPTLYTPKHLAEKILQSKSALEGERKQVTALFCDIANSTALANRLGPEEMHALLRAGVGRSASLRGDHQSVSGRRIYGAVRGTAGP